MGTTLNGTTPQNTYPSLIKVGDNGAVDATLQRLSDGEVFTLGDKIRDGVITFIRITDDKELWLRHNGIKANVGIKDAVKKKQPLFTTIDGVDIYEGDEFFRVSLKDLKLYQYKTFVNKEYNFNIMFKVAKHFSTRKAAENYIKCNKLLFNYNDVLNLFDCNSLSREGFKYKLNELVKKRL